MSSSMSSVDVKKGQGSEGLTRKAGQVSGRGRHGPKNRKLKRHASKFRAMKPLPSVSSGYPGRQSPDITSCVSTTSSHAYCTSSATRKLPENSGSGDELTEKEPVDVKAKGGKSVGTSDAAAYDEKDSAEAIMEWNPANRALLYKLMLDVDFTPIALQRNFSMLGVHARWCKLINKNINTTDIWAHANSLYDVEGLDSLRRPDPKAPKTTEFKLPNKIQSMVQAAFEVPKPAHAKRGPISGKPAAPVPSTSKGAAVENPDDNDDADVESVHGTGPISDSDPDTL